MLFAQIDKWREMGREFQTDHSKLGPSLIVASVMVLLIVGLFLYSLYRLMNRQEGRRLFNNPKQLFRSLCRAHQLARADRKLLLHISRVRHVAQPASLFLDPEQLDAAIGEGDFAGQENQIESLRTRLFWRREPPQAPGVNV